MADVWEEILGEENIWDKVPGVGNVDFSEKTELGPVQGPTAAESKAVMAELASTEEVTISAPTSGGGGTTPGQNIRDGVKFNAAIPKHLDAVNYGGAPKGTSHAPIYRSKGTNAKGMIVRDFGVNERLAGAKAGWASTQGKWGFQFHYNPAFIDETFQPPMGVNYAAFIRDLATSPMLLLSIQTGAEVGFEVLLNRREDMIVLNKPNWKDYYPTVDCPTDEDREEILARGTQYDIEYFFRVINLDPVTTWRNDKSSDWGMLMPTPVVVTLGDSEGCRKYRAQVSGLTVEHMMYAPGMVPIYTNLTFSLMRMPDTYWVEGYEYTSEGSANESGAPEFGSGTGSVPESGQSGKSPRNGKVVRGIKTSALGHELHSALTWAFEWTDAATYASSGNHGNGRALDLHLTTSPKTKANKGWKMCEWLQDTGVRKYQVTQIIFQQKIWTPARKSEGWRSMSDKGSDTHNHYDHIHVSFGPESDNDGRPPGGFKQTLKLYSSKEYWSTKAATPGGGPAPSSPGALAAQNQAYARPLLSKYGWDSIQFQALVSLWNKESNWNHLAKNPDSGAYGIPQSLPGNKMASVGSDWKTNPVTQIKWGLGYIKEQYGSPVKALQHSKNKGWY